ncbi:GNAT family N-acetyltransferase [Pseudoruegeria sp. SHC-113]|uniref:GNAT family N-acetyltransferase n=1 Tax=Pseudoruegeria sp. SHC-113 TaxID=2855439 RepID=UPI0021BAA384|nr:GNAT family N-acetyltransferase [Pseudoruegeria sp. SHC-113]MCT8159041.1 GNAT family N-acetyltransferase [Pseudoruegeria sp. SHC-113]
MAEPEIKPTVAADITALQGVLDQTGLFPSEMLPEMLAPALAGEGEAFWLTCHMGGAAVGLCYTVPEAMAEGTWNMLALAVRPDLQGQRLGAKLVAAAEARLRQAGQRILIVDTSGTQDFDAARRFYLANGYEEEARIRDFWAPGDDKVTFRKAL